MVELSCEIQPQSNNEDHARSGRATGRARGGERGRMNRTRWTAGASGVREREEGRAGNAVSGWVVKSLESHGKESV